MSFWSRSTRGLTCRYMDKTKKKEEFFHQSANWAFFVSLKKQPTFHDTNTGFPAKGRLRNERRNSILMTGYYPHLGSASDWLKICFNRSQALPRSWKCCVTSMAILCSFLRRHFAGKPVVVSGNVGCFFRLFLCGLFDTFLLFLIILSSLSCWLFCHIFE